MVTSRMLGRHYFDKLDQSRNILTVPRSSRDMNLVLDNSITLKYPRESGSDTRFVLRGWWEGCPTCNIFPGVGGPKLYFRQYQRKKEKFSLYFEIIFSGGSGPPLTTPVFA